MQPQFIYPTSLSNFYLLYSYIHISFHTSMFYIYPTHISLHLITSHTSMSYISMSNINTQQTTYTHFFKHTSNFLSFSNSLPPQLECQEAIALLNCFAPNQKLDPCDLCTSMKRKTGRHLFLRSVFSLQLIPFTLVNATAV